MKVRLATLEDVPALTRLIHESVHALQLGDYTKSQLEGALGTVYGTDKQMITDDTYYVVEVENEIAACGGWSARKTPFGGDHSPEKDDSFLDPATENARIRAFFVRPAYARRGIGRLLFETCREAAAARGFQTAQLTSTLTGIALYKALGFEPAEEITLPLPNGETLPVLLMTRRL